MLFDTSASLRGTKQSLDFVIPSVVIVILSEVEGSVRLYTNRWFDYAHHDMREDCFVVPPRNDGNNPLTMTG